MLAIISDLHLTDGTSGETIREGAFRVFRERLRDMAYDASWRKNGRYKPIKKLDLLLLGDILDVIRSTTWLDVGVRPWDKNPHSPEYVDQVQAITQGILKNNAESMKVLKSLLKTITLPPATRGGRPAHVSRDPDSEKRKPVEVRIHYMVGNHDWFYHLPGADYDGIRKMVADKLGLANPHQAPFPHDPFESDDLADLLEEHRLFARHGDIYDGFNFEGNRDASSLGDAIVVELLNRFPDTVEDELGRDLPTECRDGLKEIDNVRPLLIIPVWVDALLRRTCPDPGVVKKVKEIWDRLADDFLNLEFVKARDSAWNPLDAVDKLEAALKFSKGISMATAGRLLQKISEWTGGEESYYKNALKEREFKNRMARCIVYGHTHYPEIVPLDSSFGAQGKFDQVYFNSGTWRRIHQQARFNPDEQEFIDYNVMTYLAFFREDERMGRPFESWTGSLGV